ncbi:MAG: hypothetical protein O6913_06105 [Chloroflexi bacterium]|nr:hypothetical protein [Chloroflexota bacterium]
MVPAAEESEAVAQDPSEDGEEEGALQDALDFLFKGRVEEVIPPEELGEFHDFIREEALRRRRFAVSFRLDCGCLAWIGYSLSNIVTHDEGMEFKANPLQTYIPDHEAEVEHPEGPTEDPPNEFDDWPIWPFEIYQDELVAEMKDEGADEYDEESGLDDTLDELAEEFDEADDLAGIRQVAAMNDPDAISDE